MTGKYRTWILAATVGMILVSCGNSAKQKDEIQETAAEIEAAMMKGRRSAREFVNREWRDTMRLQEHLLNACAQRSEYELAGKKKCAEAYDSAFISTIRTVRPDMARELELKQQ